MSGSCWYRIIKKEAFDHYSIVTYLPCMPRKAASDAKRDVRLATSVPKVKNLLKLLFYQCLIDSLSIRYLLHETLTVLIL